MVKALAALIFITMTSLASSKSLFFISRKIVISAEGTKADKEVSQKGMVPRGSAVLGPSGDLAKSGITGIIHAAPGSMTNSDPKFTPTLEGLKLALTNSLIISEKQKLPNLAIPFIGGGIFLKSLGLTKKKLAQEIFSTVTERKTATKIVFVTWGEEDSAIFKEILGAHPAHGVSLVSGSITDFKIHQCSTILNAANMEVQFGGGISGVIGNATGNSGLLDNEIKEAITEFNK